VRAFHIENEAMGNLVAAVDLDGRDLNEVVGEWMDQNKDTWQAWTTCEM
jgi:glycine betaine/proline transport system substrate-binding protein